MSLIFYSGTVFWLHCWGYFERSPPPTLSPKQQVGVAAPRLGVKYRERYLRFGRVGSRSGALASVCVSVHCETQRDLCILRSGDLFSW